MYRLKNPNDNPFIQLTKYMLFYDILKKKKK